MSSTSSNMINSGPTSTTSISSSTTTSTTSIYSSIKPTGGVDEETLINDPKFRSFTGQVEKGLKSFEYSSEWPDLIQSLRNLNKVISSNKGTASRVGSIPRQHLLCKRLAQCLHPSLPAGVHLKTLETYDLIFSAIGPKRLQYDLHIYSAGLFPLYAYALISVKEAVLSIYEKYFVPLEEGLNEALEGFIISILAGMEEGSDFYIRTTELLTKISVGVGNVDFFQVFWRITEKNPAVRLPALVYLLGAKKAIESDPGRSIDLEKDALCQCLKDENILVQRASLDLVINFYPLHSHHVDFGIKRDLLEASLVILLRRDLSLNRRFFNWLLGQESKLENYYLNYSRDLLIEATLRSLQHSEDSFRIIINLTDKSEIDILDSILIHVIRKMASKSSSKKVANLFFSNLNIGYLNNFAIELLRVKPEQEYNSNNTTTTTTTTTTESNNNQDNSDLVKYLLENDIITPDLIFQALIKNLELTNSKITLFSTIQAHPDFPGKINFSNFSHFYVNFVEKLLSCKIDQVIEKLKEKTIDSDFHELMEEKDFEFARQKLEKFAFNSELCKSSNRDLALWISTINGIVKLCSIESVIEPLLVCALAEDLNSIQLLVEIQHKIPQETLEFLKRRTFFFEKITRFLWREPCVKIIKKLHLCAPLEVERTVLAYLDTRKLKLLLNESRGESCGGPTYFDYCAFRIINSSTTTSTTTSTYTGCPKNEDSNSSSSSTGCFENEEFIKDCLFLGDGPFLFDPILFALLQNGGTATSVLEWGENEGQSSSPLNQNQNQNNIPSFGHSISVPGQGCGVPATSTTTTTSLSIMTKSHGQSTGDMTDRADFSHNSVNNNDNKNYSNNKNAKNSRYRKNEPVLSRAHSEPDFVKLKAHDKLQAKYRNHNLNLRTAVEAPPQIHIQDVSESETEAHIVHSIQDVTKVTTEEEEAHTAEALHFHDNNFENEDSNDSNSSSTNSEKSFGTACTGKEEQSTYNEDQYSMTKNTTNIPTPTQFIDFKKPRAIHPFHTVIRLYNSAYDHVIILHALRSLKVLLSHPECISAMLSIMLENSPRVLELAKMHCLKKRSYAHIFIDLLVNLGIGFYASADDISAGELAGNYTVLLESWALVNDILKRLNSNLAIVYGSRVEKRALQLLSATVFQEDSHPTTTSYSGDGKKDAAILGKTWTEEIFSLNSSNYDLLQIVLLRVITTLLLADKKPKSSVNSNIIKYIPSISLSSQPLFQTSFRLAMKKENFSTPLDFYWLQSLVTILPILGQDLINLAIPALLEASNNLIGRERNLSTTPTSTTTTSVVDEGLMNTSSSSTSNEMSNSNSFNGSSFCTWKKIPIFLDGEFANFGAEDSCRTFSANSFVYLPWVKRTEDYMEKTFAQMDLITQYLLTEINGLDGGSGVGGKASSFYNLLFSTSSTNGKIIPEVEQHRALARGEIFNNFHTILKRLAFLNCDCSTRIKERLRNYLTPIVENYSEKFVTSLSLIGAEYEVNANVRVDMSALTNDLISLEKFTANISNLFKTFGKIQQEKILYLFKRFLERQSRVENLHQILGLIRDIYTGCSNSSSSSSSASSSSTNRANAICLEILSILLHVSHMSGKADLREFQDVSGKLLEGVSKKPEFLDILRENLDLINCWGLEEKERLLPLLTSIVYNLSPHLKNRSSEYYKRTVNFLSKLSNFSYTRKSWKKEIFEHLMEPNFFKIDEETLHLWMITFENLFGQESTFTELIARVSVSVSTLNIFASKEYEYESRANLIKRLAFVIYAAKKDAFTKFVQSVQERIAEALKIQVPVIQSAVFFCFRILILRFSPNHLTALWPIVVFEILSVLNQLENEPIEELSSEMSHLSSNVRKLLYLCDSLPPAQLPAFQIYRWALINKAALVPVHSLKQADSLEADFLEN